MILLRLDGSRRRVVCRGKVDLKWLDQRSRLPPPSVLELLGLSGRRCRNGSGSRAIDEVGGV